MRSKILVVQIAVAVIGVSSAAIAGGGGGAGAGGGHMGGFAGAGLATIQGAGPGSMMMHGGSVGPMTHGGPMTAAPTAGGRVQGWGGRTAWGFHNHFQDHFNFHHQNVFAFGFNGLSYDYAYDSCWAPLPTYYGWQLVNVCADYGY